MADAYINIFLNDEKLKKVQEAGLAAQVKEADGKKCIQVVVNDKELKKLNKGFPDLAFDSSNACVLPEDAETKLFNIIADMKTLDVIIRLQEKRLARQQNIKRRLEKRGEDERKLYRAGNAVQRRIC